MSGRMICRMLAVLVLLGFGFLRAQEDPILTTLVEVKRLYRNGDYRDAASALGRLAELAAVPERAQERERLRSAFAFYTAAVRYELNDEAGAREAARTYLTLTPGVTLDPAVHSKRLIAFFEKLKKEMEATERAESKANASPGSIGGGVLPSYASFAPEESAIFEFDPDPKWGDGPVRFLFVKDEARRWREAADEDARQRFQAEFWSQRDPTPLTRENEFRSEFLRRVQFADVNFSTEETRGSVTDRGMVFVVMGPPNYVGRSRVEPSQDIMSMTGITDQKMYTTREVWYYRSDRLIRELPWRELKFEFQSREGYGTGVLQKHADILAALASMTRLSAHPPR